MDVLAKEQIVTSTYEEERGKPMPSKKHASIQVNITDSLYPYRKRLKRFSELNLLVNGKKKVPDIAIYAQGLINMEEEEVVVEVMPLAVVEILSPRQSLTELTEKAKDFFEAGVQSYWLVLPEMEAIFVYTNKHDYTFFARGSVLRDEILDIEISLDEIFA